MKAVAAILLGSAVAAAALKQCTGTAREEHGNWWCGQVSHIQYEGVGTPGTYQAVTGMDANGGCSRETVSYQGPIAPLDEGVSLHFRGPLKLRQVAVYSKSAARKREEASSDSDSHLHARRHLHHVREEFKRVADPPRFRKSAKHRAGTGGRDYVRVGYYNAEEKVCDGITMLGNYGGEGSGVFDTTWGNSLAYLNSEGTGGSDTPHCLADVQIGSDKEFAIFSDQKCDGSCGFSRAEDVAYKGFAGSDQVFLFEFSMPLDGRTGFNGDMPSLWMLNARIPRTGQYHDCSCWAGAGGKGQANGHGGCGEFDIFEVLASGDTKCKSTFHTNMPGGSSDYFDRPVDSPIKVAAIFDAASSSVSVKVLDPGTDFSAGLSRAEVEPWIKVTRGGPKQSLYQLRE